MANWVKGWFKKSKKTVAIVEYDNYASLNNDPIASSTASLPISYFSGGGSSGLGISEAVTKVIQFKDGFAMGVVDGGVSTWNFFKSLGTQQGWQKLGQGYVNLAEMSNIMSPKGMMLKVQMANAVGNYVTKIPSMTAYEMGHDLAFAIEKVGEVVLFSKGAGFGTNVIKLKSIGQAAFQSSTIGGKSALFGRARLGSFGGKANGILNRGYRRIGWSWGKATQTHYFQPRIGPTYGAKHYWSWFNYKP